MRKHGAQERDVRRHEPRRLADGNLGEIGDNRLTVMAAITFMDDREDLKRRVAELEGEMLAIREQHRATDTIHSKLENEIAAAITQAATKLSDITRRLNGEDDESA